MCHEIFPLGCSIQQLFLDLLDMTRNYFKNFEYTIFRIRNQLCIRFFNKEYVDGKTMVHSPPDSWDSPCIHHKGVEIPEYIRQPEVVLIIGNHN